MAIEIQEEGNEASELEVIESQDAAKSAPKEEDNIPDEFKELSKADLAGMLKHTRKELGRQNAEVGEIRKLADELIKSQLKSKPEPEPVTEVDFFENPKEAIRQAVETNPRVLAAEQYAVQAQRAQALQLLAQKHPDYTNIVQDANFANWIKSSKIRSKLFQEAEAYDVDAADHLLSTYKQLNPVAKPQEKEAPSAEEKASRETSMKAAAVDTGGSGESGKKIYRRTDLIRLKMRDPAKFSDMQDEIDKAYREGRVK